MSEPILQEYTVEGDDYVDAGAASSNIKRSLKMIGVSSDICRRAAIIAYEAEMNLVIHAGGGIIKTAISEDNLVITIADKGPGIPDIEKAMTAGYSTASEHAREMGFGAGMGLPNIKRNSDAFDIQSTVGVGTTLTCRINFN